jgi:hypothetical protein
VSRDDLESWAESIRSQLRAVDAPGVSE